MRNIIRDAGNNEPTKKEMYGAINKKRRKWPSKTNNDSGEFDIKYGKSSIALASTHRCTLRTNKAISDITRYLFGNKIDIACIQETHKNQNDVITNNGYGLYFFGYNGNIEAINNPN